MRRYKFMYYTDLIKQMRPGEILTYEEKLFTVDWMLFREKIVERDKQTCQSCNTGIYRKMSPEEHQARVNQIEADRIVNPYIYPYDQESIDQLGPIDPEIAEQLRQFKFKNNPPDISDEIKRVPEVILEVHHKSYIYGALPWQYPEDWLETLCDTCHHKKHFGENGKAPISRKCYTDKSKREEVKMPTCDRCNGLGYIWEYRHIQGGVCFRCGGAGMNPDNSRP